MRKQSFKIEIKSVHILPWDSPKQAKCMNFFGLVHHVC